MELHVWGPAFSLPSINAQCVAAIAYLSQNLPPGSWALVASSDPGLSPTNELPALRHESIWIGGFRNIVDYISKLVGTDELEGLDKADCSAYSSFIESRGQELLDLSLYASSNYSVVRPIYSKLQPFPLPWVIPPAIRAAAKARTAHLELPLEDEAETKLPEYASLIRLDNLATNFFSPLQQLRGRKRFFLGASVTSLDCLALGYLSLSLLPDLPNSWLANSMRKSFPQLCAFVHDLQKSFFGGSVTLEDAQAGKGALPWKSPSRGGLVAIAGILGSSIADSIPVLSQLRQSSRLKTELEKDADVDKEALKELASMDRRELYTTVGSIIAGLGLFVGFMFQQGLISLRAEPQPEGLHQYGEAGAALAVLAQQMDMQTAMENERMRHRNEASLVEVDIEPVGAAIHDGTQ